MANWQVFGTLAAGNQNASLFDTLSGQIAINVIVKCGASGTNVITLTPDSTNGPLVGAYTTQQHYSFIAANTSTGAVTLALTGLSALKLFGPDATTQITTGGITAGREYIIGYNAALDSAAGGFQIMSNTPQSAGMVLLNTLTASSSAALQDTTSLTAAYSNYLLTFQNILPATDNVQLELQVHSGGAYKATSYVARLAVFVAAYATATPTTFIPLSGTDMTNSAPGFSGSIIVPNPSQTASPKMWTSSGSYVESGSGTFAVTQTAGYWNGGNGAIDGFQVLMSTGNIASGTVKVYGIS